MGFNLKFVFFYINLRCLKRLLWNGMKFVRMSLINVTYLVLKYYVILLRD